MADDQQAVRILFNRKAPEWAHKYRPGGPLAHRLTLFAERLNALHPPPGRVLDLGCGTGDLAVVLAARGYEVTACDIAERMLDEGRQVHPQAPLAWVLLPHDWEVLPFTDGHFDAIVAASVLEYLPHPEAVLRECHRVLKQDGVLVCNVPNIRHLQRKIERVLQRLTGGVARRHLLGALPLLDNYLQYLALSRGRRPLAAWLAAAASFGLMPLPDEEGQGHGGAASPLLLLCFARRY